MVAERGLPSRSQMIAELIRHELAEHSESRADAVLAGTITLIYRAESGRVRQALAQTQSAYVKEVISSQHVFLEDDQSLEVLLVQGPAPRLHAVRRAAQGARRAADQARHHHRPAAAAAFPWRRGEHRPRGSCRAERTMSTADPHGAQAHARAMGSTRVEAMPTLPAAPPRTAAGRRDRHAVGRDDRGRRLCRKRLWPRRAAAADRPARRRLRLDARCSTPSGRSSG